MWSRTQVAHQCGEASSSAPAHSRREGSTSNRYRGVVRSVGCSCCCLVGGSMPREHDSMPSFARPATAVSQASDTNVDRTEQSPGTPTDPAWAQGLKNTSADAGASGALTADP